MAREVVKAIRKTVQPHKFALEKEIIEVGCDDGAEYVFERPTDEPEVYRLARRVQPDGTVSTSSGRLPSAVVETLDDVGIEWEK